MEKDALHAIEITVQGRVQGVFYRASTVQAATALGLVGWVKNQRDGSVLIHGEGKLSMLNELLEWAQQGPEYANVTNISSVNTDIEGFSQFTIVYD
ncbi:MAG: acylphosphatase [Cellvibrionaceae bacterium]